MSTFLYTRPSEELTKTATISINTGGEDPTYPKSNLVNGRPALPAKLTGQSGSFVFDLATAKRVDLAAIFHHNLDAALEVRLQANTTNTWATPPLNQTFTIAAAHADKFPVNAWLNLKELVPVDANRTYRYWRLIVVGTNTSIVVIGEFVLYGSLRNLGVRNIRKNSTRTFKRPGIVHRTPYLVQSTLDFGTTVRSVDVEVQPDATYLADIEEWYRDAHGVELPFTIVPHNSEADAWFVTFLESELSYKREQIGLYPASLSFQEVSRGLFP